MSSTTALVPYLFEGHRIRVSTDGQGEAWFAAADVAAALGQQPIATDLASLPEEEQCLHSQEGPGSEGCSLALISEDGLLRLLFRSDSPTARRMRRWLSHEVLPCIQCRQPHSALQEGMTIEAMRRQSAAALLREADGILDLTGVTQAEALLSALAAIQANSASPGSERREARCLSRHGQRGTSELLAASPRPLGRRRPCEQPAVARLTAEQLAERLDGTIRSTNQRLAACGLQIRNDDDDWQLTAAGRDWGVALPLYSRGERRQQIIWDPAVVMLLEGEG